MDKTASATVLVVDDNAANLALARDTLEDEDYRVVLASGGAEALEKFAAVRPDIVLLDVRMPELDGFQVCERIRKLPSGADVPVIFLTALRDVDTFDRALRAGGDDFLTKPVRPTELVVRVKAALKLRNMRTDLHEHYELLRHQRDDLMRLSLQRERLMAFVVHDLKNPVNAMDLHAQLMLREPNLPPKVHSSATQIRSEARQLNRLILNLLDLSKADEGKLSANLADVDLAAVGRDVFSELEVSARARGVSLDMSLEITSLRADDDLLRRLLGNLVENAIRHAPKESVVRVTSAAAGAATEIRVLDEGAGVPPELREAIFEAFTQLASGDRVVRRSGRGLGLTFCRLVAEAHGGDIRAEDVKNGSSFCVRLPHA